MNKNKIISGILIIIAVVIIILFFYSKLSVSKLNENPQTSPAIPSRVASPGLPRGVFSLISPNQDFNVSLDNPYVRGLAIGQKWQEFETSYGQYNWSLLDREISAGISHDKYILLRLDSGGKNTPSWAMNGVSTFSFTDQNEYHDTFNESVTIPVFWDPIFLTEKKKMITDAGMHFSSSKIDIVVTSCANATTNDWNPVSKTETDYGNWVKLGFSPDKLISACEQIIDTAAYAFPNSMIAMSIDTSSGLFDPTPGYISNAIISYASTKYPNRFISETNNLSANGTGPISNGSPVNPAFQDGHYQASQMLWFVTADPTCRMNGKNTPCDAHTMLSQALTKGINQGKLYIEVYAKDIANPSLQDTLDAANKLMGV